MKHKKVTHDEAMKALLLSGNPVPRFATIRPTKRMKSKKDYDRKQAKKIQD